MVSIVVTPSYLNLYSGVTIVSVNTFLKILSTKRNTVKPKISQVIKLED